MAPTLHTERLRLEPMAETHLDAMAALHADPEVMRYIGRSQAHTRQQSTALVNAWRQRFAAHGFGWFALIERDSGVCVGAASLQHFELKPGAPLELAWRLSRAHWGHGYATEAARELARWAIDDLDAPEIYAVARAANLASLRIMEKIGMRYVGVEEHWGEPLPTYVLRAGQARG